MEAVVDAEIESAEADSETSETSDLPVLYPEGVEEPLEASSSDEEELAVSDWPEPVG